MHRCRNRKSGIQSNKENRRDRVQSIAPVSYFSFSLSRIKTQPKRPLININMGFDFLMVCSTKRGPDEPGNDLFRWSCVRSVPAAAEKAVKENRHPALWPGAYSYARRVYPSGLSCCASGAGVSWASGWPSSCGSGSIMSSMLQPRAWATL